MSFGRNKNIVRRPQRPDGQFHRTKRRRHLTTPLALTSDSVFHSVLHLLKMPFRKR